MKAMERCTEHQEELIVHLDRKLERQAREIQRRSICKLKGQIARDTDTQRTKLSAFLYCQMASSEFMGVFSDWALRHGYYIGNSGKRALCVCWTKSSSDTKKERKRRHLIDKKKQTVSITVLHDVVFHSF